LGKGSIEVRGIMGNIKGGRRKQSTASSGPLRTRIGALALAIGIAIALAACGEAEPVATAPAEPGESEQTPEQWSPEQYIPNLEDIELSVEQYITAEALGERFIELEVEWYNAGATEETYKNIDTARHDATSWAKHINRPIDTAYKHALFSKGYLDEDSEYITNVVKNHEMTVIQNFYSHFDMSEGAAGEPWRQWKTIRSMDVLEDGEDVKEIAVNYTRHDNSSKNDASASIDGITGGYALTFMNEDGVWKITSLHPSTE
jgi:hypothetical protein